MKQISNKHIFVFVVVFLIAVFYAYMYYKPEPPVINEDVFKKIYLDFNNQNELLQLKINKLIIDNKAKQLVIDSLQSLKPKIKYVYIQKSNQIENASVGNIINEYNRVFSTSGIK